MIKDKDLEQLAQSRGFPIKEEATILGVILPSLLMSVLGPIAMSVSMQRLLINFNNEGITLATLDNITGKLETDSLKFINKYEVTNIDFKQKLLGYNLTVKTANENFEFKVNKFLGGAKWHKQNLAKILQFYNK